MTNQFDLLDLKQLEPGKVQVRSGDGNRIYIFDYQQHHRLTPVDIKNLDDLLNRYHEALAASTNVLYRIAQWSQKSPEDGGSFAELVDLLPDVKRALDMANIDLDETAVNPP